MFQIISLWKRIVKKRKNREIKGRITKTKMKVYGFDELDSCLKTDFINPDCADMKGFARKSSAGFLEKKSGDRRGMRSSAQKRHLRRLIKRRARLQAKKKAMEGFFEWANEPFVHMYDDADGKACRESMGMEDSDYIEYYDIWEYFE